MKRSLRPKVLVRVVMSVDGKVIPNTETIRLLADGAAVPRKIFKEFSMGEMDLPTFLERLRSRWGVKKLLCEGGPSFLKSLLEMDAVDDLYVTILPILLGGRDVMNLTGLPEGFLPQERRFRLKTLKQHKGEKGAARLHYLRDRRT
jgi:riboflavin biosynthesis pyrimidine reductase